MREFALLYIVCLLVACGGASKEPTDTQGARIKAYAEKGDATAQLQLAQR